MDRMIDYYKSADSYSEMLRGQQTDAFTPHIELFEQFANPNDSIIDVGCRVGTITLLLREAGFNAIGMTFPRDSYPPSQVYFARLIFRTPRHFLATSTCLSVP